MRKDGRQSNCGVISEKLSNIGLLLSTFLQLCAYLCNLSSLTARVMLGPGIVAAGVNANQPKVVNSAKIVGEVFFYRKHVVKTRCVRKVSGLCALLEQSLQQ